MGIRKHQHGKERTVCLMPHMNRGWHGTWDFRLLRCNLPFPYLIGRRLLIPSQGAFYLLISSLVIQPVYPPIQGEHAAAFPAPVALEHVLFSVEVELPS